MENQQVEQHYGELLDGGDWWAVLEINYDYARSVHLDTGEKRYWKVVAWQYVKDEEFPEGRMVAWMNGKPAIRDCDWPDENWILNRFERMPHDFLVEEPKGAKEYGWS